MAFPEDTEFRKVLVELMPLLPKAKDAIQLLVQELKHGSMISWDNIRIVVIQLYGQHSHEPFELCPTLYCPSKEKIEKVIFSVLPLFDMHKCSDKSVIADVLEILCLTRHNICNIARFGGCTAIPYNECNDQTTMSIFEKILVFPYKDISSLVPLISKSSKFVVDCNWVAVLAKSGDYDLLKLVISHGATLIVPQQETFIETNYNFINVLFMDLGIQSADEYKNFKIHFEQNLLKLDDYSWKRMYFVITVHKMLFYKSNFRRKTDTYMQCANILINFTPEPLITLKEIKSFFSIICCGRLPKDHELQMLDRYKICFPEISEASTPRTLKHLSRFQVRESLRTAKSFPYGAQSLCEPKKIQDYINLKDIL